MYKRTLLQQPPPTFGGHETFVFRYNWLKKGFEAIQADPKAFHHDDALVRLGVGKNMVRSIRHWCLALGIIEEGESIGRTRELAPTTFGQQLLDNSGWDAYLEDRGTLWLLHWQLATNRVRGLVWHISLSLQQAEFSKALLQALVERQLERLEIKTTSQMISREVDCFLRTYVSPLRKRAGVIAEETIDCPLTELDLIRYDSGDSVYRFNVGAKPTLPTAIFGYALLTYLSEVMESRRTVALDECIYQIGSPGQIFKLDENSVVDYIEQLATLTEGRLQFQETAGLHQIYLHDLDVAMLRETAESLLKQYYV
ncbi:MAG: DUF4007 family protein [Ardenticatenales bacterium]|nr:DUF4007 family protein [Ardenticatenales bacterium]